MSDILIDIERNTFALHYVNGGVRRVRVEDHISDLIKDALELSEGGAAFITSTKDDGGLRVWLYVDGSFVGNTDIPVVTFATA